MARAKKKPIPPEAEAPPPKVEFCVNCSDIENMALTDEPDHMERIRRRFEECERTGKFQGEMCARMFIAADEDAPGPLFEEEE